MTRMTKTNLSENKKYYRILYDATATDGVPYRPSAEIVLKAASLEHAIRDLRRSMRSECRSKRGVDAIIEISRIERVNEADLRDYHADVLAVAEPHFTGKAMRPSTTVEFERQLATVRRQRRLKPFSREK